MAAVIAAEHPKWDERPIVIAVKKPDSTVTEQGVLDYYTDKICEMADP